VAADISDISTNIDSRLRIKTRRRITLPYFILLSFFTILIYLRPQEIYTNFPIAGVHRFLGILIAISIFMLIDHHVIGKLRHTIMIYFALYLIAIVVSIPFGLWPGGSVQVIEDIILKELILFMGIVLMINDERKLKLIIMIIVLSTAILGVNAIIRYLNHEYIIEGYRAGLRGTFHDPNDMALHLLISIPLGYFILYKIQNWKFLFISIALILLTGLIITYSRGGMIGLAVVGLSIAWYDKQNRIKLLLMYLGIFILVIVLSPYSMERMSTLASGQEGSLLARWAILKRGISICLENPIIGVGFGNFRISEGATHEGVGNWQEAHNSLVQITAETGILGLVGYVGCILLMIGISVKQVQDDSLKNLMLGLKTGTIAYISCGLFLSQAYNWYFFYLLALTIAAMNLAVTSPLHNENVYKSSQLDIHAPGSQIADPAYRTFVKYRWP